MGSGGPLLRAVRSLYDRSRSLVRIAGNKSGLYPVHVGLRQGCPLSPVLFIIFMDRISRRSQGPEGVQVWEPQDFISAFCRMMLSCWLHQTRTFSMYWRRRLQSECEAAGMRISTSKSEAMVLDRKRVACPLRCWWRDASVRLTGGLDWRSLRRLCTVGVPDRRVLKKELSRKAMLLIYT
ncbi:hypothetical protein L3Q82_023826, partial [Scortum barcoo]